MSILFLHYVIKIYSDRNCKQQLVNNFKTAPEGTKREELGNKTKLEVQGCTVTFTEMKCFLCSWKTYSRPIVLNLERKEFCIPN